MKLKKYAINITSKTITSKFVTVIFIQFLKCEKPHRNKTNADTNYMAKSFILY